jgi:murein DD-endopeptidase MepM/ murein hydrolase activator NlpD
MRRVVLAIGVLTAGAAGVSLGLSGTSANAVPACRFDMPVGPPNASGYYDAQPFGANYHLGSDWSSVKGGDSDLGFFVFAASDGVVTDAQDYEGGWGNVIRIQHACGDRVESLYAHLDRRYVVRGARVARGQPIGTIGTAGGRYRAHLHFEIRDRWLPLGGGYAADRTGYLDPTDYIRHHR